MPLLTSLESDARFTVKALRLGDRFFVGNTMQDGHTEIAIMDGIEKDLDRARVEDNLSTDAAVIGVNGGDIYIGGYSSALQLPVLGKEREVRDITVKLLREQNPAHNVMEVDRVEIF